MTMALRPDNFDANLGDGAIFANLWVTTTLKIENGDWIAIHTADTTNPGAVTGESYRTAISTDAESMVNTVGVACEAVAAGAAARFIQVQIKGRRTQVSVDDDGGFADGGPLCIHSSAGQATGQLIDTSTGTINRRTIGIIRSAPTTAASGYTTSGESATVDILMHSKFM